MQYGNIISQQKAHGLLAEAGNGRWEAPQGERNPGVASGAGKDSPGTLRRQMRESKERLPAMRYSEQNKRVQLARS